MRRKSRHDDDDDDDWDAGDDGDDDGSVDCPHCGATMYEDAGYCPSCERWITAEDLAKRPQPLWVVVGIAICLAVALTWVIGGF